jgi:hypothetical protein
MAVVVIGDACLCGAADGLMSGRFLGSATPANYANIKAVAQAVNTEFLAVNAASGAPIADADNAQIAFAVYAAARSVLAGQGAVSQTATDYVATANQIYGLAKEMASALT